MVDILAALTGAIQGYSSGSGLDLAQKLREQAALDELALEKLRQAEGIRQEFDIASEGRREELAGEERRRQGIEALLNTLAQASGLGVSGGLDTSGLLEGVDAFDEQGLQGLQAGLASAVAAETARRSDVAGAEKTRISAATQERQERESESLIAQRAGSTNRPFAQLQKDDAGNLISVLTYPDGRQTTNIISTEKKPTTAKSGGLTENQRVDEMRQNFKIFFDQEMDILQAQYEFDEGGIPPQELAAAEERAWERTKQHLERIGIPIDGSGSQDVFSPTEGGEAAIDLDAIAARVQEGG
jgi:hypothetical protein